MYVQRVPLPSTRIRVRAPQSLTTTPCHHRRLPRRRGSNTTVVGRDCSSEQCWRWIARRPASSAAKHCSSDSQRWAQVVCTKRRISSVASRRVCTRLGCCVAGVRFKRAMCCRIVASASSQTSRYASRARLRSRVRRAARSDRVRSCVDSCSVVGGMGPWLNTVRMNTQVIELF